jgi:hypothetical protein
MQKGNAMHCPHCQTELPDDARFCIECGMAVRVTTGETVQLPSSPDTTIACTACHSINPSHARFCVFCGAAIHHGTARPAVSLPRSTSLPQPQQTRDSGFEAGITLLLIGAAFLIPMIFRLPPMIWPNILMVLGIAQLLIHLRRGTLFPGIRNAIWLFGLGVLFLIPKLLLPGLFLLVGLTLLIESWNWRRKAPF